ncbi:MAG: hypothetical protein GF418_09480, partial [Chitinivibrionales bacterium]|nr:hypothetical protein [Chitinivibrionales bacterium]MBD3395840.1 hypothetical protein [Chitinivibrionales bacterium]
MIRSITILCLSGLLVAGCDLLNGGGGSSTTPSVTTIEDGTDTTVTTPTLPTDTIETALGGKEVEMYLYGTDTLVMKEADGTKTYFGRDAGSGTKFNGDWKAYKQVTSTAVYDIVSDSDNYYGLTITEGTDGTDIAVDSKGTVEYTASNLPAIVGIWKLDQDMDTYGYAEWYQFLGDGTYENLWISQYNDTEPPDTFSWDG